MIGLHFRLQMALRMDDGRDELHGQSAFGGIAEDRCEYVYVVFIPRGWFPTQLGNVKRPGQRTAP
jgi:hypothetical protein